MKTGALIITNGYTDHANQFEPFAKVGSLSAVQRIILNFHAAHIDITVVVHDTNQAQMDKHIARMGVVCLQSEIDHPEMFDNIKTGLHYLMDKCGQVLVTPTDIPLFTSETVKKLINCNQLLANPSYHGKLGHPLLINTSIIPHILSYNGPGGLQGAINQSTYQSFAVEVEDEGILIDIESSASFSEVVQTHSLSKLHPEIKIRLSKEEPFFGPGTYQLLFLIEHTNSVRLASQQMGISYSKAWKMIGLMENQLSCQLVIRQQGGKNGGSAILSQKGKKLIETYAIFEKECKQTVQNIFNKYFAGEW